MMSVSDGKVSGGGSSKSTELVGLDLKVWKDGELQPCSVAEFTHQLREFAVTADQVLGAQPDSVIGERFVSAADLIDELYARLALCKYAC